MTPSDPLLLQELRRDEGVRYVPYLDSVGVKTVGVGHNLLFRGIGPDESISAYCWRRGYTRRIALIDWLMNEKDHCKTAHESEKNGSHLAPEYKE